MDEINYIRNKYKFETSKKLGQNFIIDEDVLEEISEGSDTVGNIVIEVGPGIGSLTAKLAETARCVIAIELDERLIPILTDRFTRYDNVEIIHGDVLEVDLKKIADDAKEKYGNLPIRIVGNLPYYITTPIILRLLRRETPAYSVTIMVQKEVADRIVAEPGTKLCGALTYAVHYYTVPKKICVVGSECFYPRPKVDSEVIRLELRKEKPVEVRDEELLFKCIKAGFLQRRKTLLNSLQSLGEYDKEEIRAALEKAGIDSRRRAESLSLEEFARLAAALTEENV